jgi:hypothetical protein
METMDDYYYEPGKEEKFVRELMDECQCTNLKMKYGVIYTAKSRNDKITLDLDTVEKMYVDIIESYVTFYTSTGYAYIIDFSMETIRRISI